MNPVLGAVAAVVVTGAVIAISAREGRLAVVGLAATLVFAALLGTPLDAPLGLAASLTGGILAAYLLWIAVRGGGMTSGSRLGWPTEALLAGAAFFVGLGTHGLGAPALGPVEAQAAGFALAALAVVPVATGRDVLRIGMGLFLLLQAALLLRVGLDGHPPQLEQVVTAALVAALGGAVAALGYAARSDGPGGFDLATESRVRLRRPLDARRDSPRSPEAMTADGPR
jgi:hypothetical protein